MTDAGDHLPRADEARSLGQDVHLLIGYAVEGLEDVLTLDVSHAQKLQSDRPAAVSETADFVRSHATEASAGGGWSTVAYRA